MELEESVAVADASKREILVEEPDNTLSSASSIA